MTMFIDSLGETGPIPALVKTMAFNEARLGVIAENVANAHTPGYRAKQLDPEAFQASLGQAIAARRGRPNAPFVVRGEQFSTDEHGHLRVKPGEQPVSNVLFHDGTNVSLEREMAALAETGMMHELAGTLLSGRYDGLRKAIRGTL